MAKGLTEKQRKILEFIIDFQKENGFPPTIRELGDAFAIGSLRGVTVHLDALVCKGYMTRERTSRSIRITAPDPRDVPASDAPASGTSLARTVKSDACIRLPLARRSGGWHIDASTIITGEKLQVNDEVERYIALPEEVAGSASGNGYVIRVGATGVYGEPIVPGDLLIVRPQQSAVPGELAVTISQGDLNISRAESADYSPSPSGGQEIPVTSSSDVIGRVVGLIRYY
jgi:repressor LexA